ncbi:hypothetical protein SD71_03540 [Cohnella kolymensis]|uniref:Creatinase N-terminal domain-containing protein n=1 Tax=Cohnella kolymensis TaxID=1590652 RepID=A0ABR5A9D6_9BACL|nr:hypothetical protein [Cohnella kolymensis]KIL37676.1 hypothetical protein SD71_03540 [Cohnella kolymensis]
MREPKLIRTNPYIIDEVEADIPAFTKEDYQCRLNLLVDKLKRDDLTHAIIYADREHFSNLEYLTGFEPRFEELCSFLTSQAKPPLSWAMSAGATPLHRRLI